MKKISYLAFVLAISACAVGRRVNYDGIVATVPVIHQSISVATIDEREQVVTGKRKPSFVGYMRSTAGIAYPIHTESNKPFAEAVSANIAASLQAQGARSVVIPASANQASDQIVQKFKSNATDRLMLLKCRQFQTDGYGATSLLYDITVNVYDKNGQLLTTKSFLDKKRLGGSAAWGPGNYDEYMPAALKQLMEDIFKDPGIAEALQASAN